MKNHNIGYAELRRRLSHHYRREVTAVAVPDAPPQPGSGSQSDSPPWPSGLRLRRRLRRLRLPRRRTVADLGRALTAGAAGVAAALVMTWAAAQGPALAQARVDRRHLTQFAQEVVNLSQQIHTTARLVAGARRTQ